MFVDRAPGLTADDLFLIMTYIVEHAHGSKFLCNVRKIHARGDYAHSLSSLKYIVEARTWSTQAWFMETGLKTACSWGP